MKSDDHIQWQEAINSEKESILDHDTFEFVDYDAVPTEKTLLDSRWVFRIKNDGRYKARFVVKGFTQVQGVDYMKTYAPVMSKSSLRCLLSIAALENWDIDQMDVKTAFLHGELDTDLYLRTPQGFDVPNGKVIKLKKSLYGLKQAPLIWYNTLKDFLLSQGFEKNMFDSSVFTRRQDGNTLIIGVYVDDLLITGNNRDDINAFKAAISATFNMEDLGELHKILGMEITRDRVARTLKISQSQYIKKLLVKFNVQPHKRHAPVPLCKATFNATFQDLKNQQPLDPKLPYRSVIGAILYLSVCTRPDLAFAISTLASFNSNPRLCHWRAAKELLSYIHSTPEEGITYGKRLDDTLHQISVYADADYASKHNDRRSRGGSICYMNGGPIDWHTSLQSTIAKCTTESELYAMSAACSNVTLIRHFLNSIGYQQSAIKCYEDNKGAVDWIHTDSNSSRLRQIEVEARWLKQRVQRGEFEMLKIPTADQRADMLTKCMDPTPFYNQMGLNGMTNRLQVSSYLTEAGKDEKL